MYLPRKSIVRSFWQSGLLLAIGLGVFFTYVNWYAQTGRIFPGVMVGPVSVGGLAPQEAYNRVIHLTGRRQLSNHIKVAYVRWGSRRWELKRYDAEGSNDIVRAIHIAASIGKEGTFWRQAGTFLSGLFHGHDVSLDFSMDEGTLVEHLEAIAKEIRDASANAWYEPKAGVYTNGIMGQELDVEASLRAIQNAAKAGVAEAELVVRSVAPFSAKRELYQVSRYQIGTFATPILAADTGRVHNITLAVHKINSRVVQPEQVFSFNDVVGPRDAEHGWAQAKELYQGEFVLGYGGGICQVSSTLYNAVLLAGLKVEERYHHDRPLQYISPGRDATVAWKLLDFRFRNNTKKPVTISARVIQDSPLKLEVSLYAPSKPPKGNIRLEDSDVKYYPAPLEEKPDILLPANQRVVEDEGQYGIEVKIFRVFEKEGQEHRELVSHDYYRPKPGRVRVGVGNAPGSNRLVNPGLQ